MKMSINTYPEMNAKIVEFLRISDEAVDQYAAQRIEELEAKVEEMQKALEWYADKNNHDWTVDFCDHLTLSNAMKDEGERARQALKGDTQ